MRETARKSWPVQDAKARFSELLDACMANGPQVVTRRGADAAVLVSVSEWNRLSQAARPTLKELLLAPSPRFDIPVPDRGRLSRRPIPEFE
jgi:antitoxin Phd